MKKSFLMIIFTSVALVTFSQEVRMTKEAKKNYIAKNVSAEEKDEGDKMLIYNIILAESEEGDEFFNLTVEKGNGQISTKASKMNFPEIINLTRMRVPVNSEVDLLNYLAENGWEIVSIENAGEKKSILRKYYIKKVILQ